MKKYKPAYKSADKIPEKYFEGLNEKERTLMTKEILKRPDSLKYWSADKAYSKRLKKEKESLPKSQYTLAYHKKYGKENTGSLEKISKATGIRLSILKEVYKRGIKAWETGHKPGVYPNQWARSRIYSFIMGGKTQKTADRDLWQLHLKSKRKRNPRDEELLKQLRINKDYIEADNVIDEDLIKYTVRLNNQEIGIAGYIPSHREVWFVEIDKRYRRKGITTYLYDYIEADQNIKLKPSDSLKPLGKLFWQNRLKIK